MENKHLEQFIEEMRAVLKSWHDYYHLDDYGILEKALIKLLSQVHNNAVQEAINMISIKFDDSTFSINPQQALIQAIEDLKIETTDQKLERGAKDFVERFGPVIKKMSEE